MPEQRTVESFQSEPSMPVMVPRELRIFASPALRFISRIGWVTPRGIKQKVLCLMTEDFFVASTHGGIVRSVPLKCIVDITKQQVELLGEDVVVRFRVDAAVKAVALRFGDNSTTFLRVLSACAPHPVPVNTQPKGALSIAQSVAGIVPSNIVRAGDVADEHSASRASPSARLSFDAGSSAEPFRRRMEKLYAAYAPDKLQPNAIEEALVTFRGAEESLLRTLVNKYGPEPSATDEEARRSASPQPRIESQPLSPTRSPAFSAASRPLSALPSPNVINEPSHERSSSCATASSDPSANSDTMFALLPEMPTTAARVDSPRDAFLSPEACRILEDLEILRHEVSQLKAEKNVQREASPGTYKFRVDDSESDDGVDRLAPLPGAEPTPTSRAPTHEARGHKTLDVAAALNAFRDAFVSCARAMEHDRSVSSDFVKEFNKLDGPLRSLFDSVLPFTTGPAITVSHSAMLEPAFPPSRGLPRRDVEVGTKPLRDQYLPAVWVTVDLGEKNGNVFPPTTRKYHRLLSEQRSGPGSLSARIPETELVIATRSQLSTGFGGWAIRASELLAVCPGVVRRLPQFQSNDPGIRGNPLLAGASLSEQGGYYSSALASRFHGSSVDASVFTSARHERSLTIATTRHVVVIEFDVTEDRDCWLQRLMILRQRNQQCPGGWVSSLPSASSPTETLAYADPSPIQSYLAFPSPKPGIDLEEIETATAEKQERTAYRTTCRPRGYHLVRTPSGLDSDEDTPAQHRKKLPDTLAALLNELAVAEASSPGVADAPTLSPFGVTIGTVDPADPAAQAFPLVASDFEEQKEPVDDGFIDHPLQISVAPTPTVFDSNDVPGAVIIDIADL
jgi:hypothetical protein